MVSSVGLASAKYAILRLNGSILWKQYQMRMSRTQQARGVASRRHFFDVNIATWRPGISCYTMCNRSEIMSFITTFMNHRHISKRLAAANTSRFTVE